MFDGWLWLWNWLTRQDASRATVILMFFTAWYVLLTRGMVKAMRLQTRAMVQPVLEIEFQIQPDSDNEKGYFTIRNQGTQPFLLLDVRLVCRIHEMRFPIDYQIWDKNVIAPQGVFRPKFDISSLRKQNFTAWSPDFISYNVRVVASDVNRQAVLTYAIYPDNGISSCVAGMPWGVRLRYFFQPFKSRYYRVKYGLSDLMEKRWIKRIHAPRGGTRTSPRSNGESD
jgi:hypothetical protein